MLVIALINLTYWIILGSVFLLRPLFRPTCHPNLPQDLLTLGLNPPPFPYSPLYPRPHSAMYLRLRHVILAAPSSGLRTALNV